MESIIIDEDSNDVIDVDSDNSEADIVEVPNINNLRKMGCYDDIIKENKLIGEFIDKCLELDYSDGMNRAINKSLIPSYLRTSKVYRVSDAFNKVITRALCNIATQPHWKFSIVKELCESLKASRKRRKKGANLTHAATKNTAKLKKKSTKASAIVLSDDSDGYEVPIIDLEENTKDTRTEDKSKSKDSLTKEDTEKENYIEIDIENVIPPSNVNLGTNNDDIILEDSEPLDLMVLDNEKENNTNNVEAIKSRSKPVKYGENSLVIDKRRLSQPLPMISVPTVCISDEETTESNDLEVRNPKISDVETLLVPHKEEAFSGYDEQMIMDKIKVLEAEIATYKRLIEEFEEREVDDDSHCSAYIVCDGFKAKVVKLYQQLCKLTGEKPVKKREVRLKPVNERSELPMQKLEEFINNNIGSDGLPHFPDFCDVVQCVKDANYSGNLGWSNSQIMKEARALFTYCGQALQKNRQRREWRDMLHLVKSEMIDDPADNDPELMARLQANRKRAVTRETEVLDRYSIMDYQNAEIEKAEDSDEEHETAQTSNKTSTHSDNIINRVRIVPVSVPLKISRIVNEDSQVEVVVSKHNNTENDSNKTSIENRKSPNLTSKDNTVINTENKISHSITCIGEELSRDTEIPDELSKNTKIAEELSRNTEIAEELRNYSQKSVPAMSSTISSCSISMMLALAGGKPIMPVQVPSITSDGGKSSTQNNEASCPEKESSLSVCHIEDNPSEEDVEIVKNNAPKELDQDDCIVTSSNTAVETNNSNKELSTQPNQKTPEVIEINESLDTSTKDNNNTVETKNENPCSQSSIDILERYLNARVVLQKMKITYETSDNSKETNDNDCKPETVQNGDLKIKIKEEPCIDIQNELDELGDNFTTTVFDIQDPFLVVEISSDSETEDEEAQDNLSKEHWFGSST